MNRDLTEASAAAQALDRDLGDPRDPASVIAFRAMVELDEREAFPESAVAALDAWGLGRHYFPEAHGGALRSFEVLAALARAVARRDLTVAVAHAKTFLGVGPVIIAGTRAQKDRLGAAVVSGWKVALGLTERAHGGDLFATETTALATADGYALSGEKWLINNATRGDAVTVLARTDARGGPRGFSLFLVDKREVSGCTPLPKIPTHGVRGADISGLSFDGCLVPTDARIGAAGHGIEIMMKSLQLTRALVPAISLGALDTALRHVLAFARERRAGSVTVAQIPHARRVLSETFVELYALDALVRAGARSVHAAPERLAIWSAVIKYLVPTRVEAALRSLAVVLGARHFLRGSTFEKLLRDHSLVPLFDGSTVVNLHALAQELPRMTADRASARRDEDRHRERIAALYDLRAPLPAFRPERLDVLARGGDEAPLALASAAAEIAALPPSAVDPDVRRYLLSTVREIDAAIAANAEAAVSKERPMALPPEAFAAAERHARLHAATAAVLVWLHNRDGLDAFFASGEWLALALARLLGSRGSPAAAAWHERAFLQLAELDEQDCCLAIEPFASGEERRR